MNYFGSDYREVLRLVKCSMKAEQIFCSIVTQMTYIPQFKNQPSLEIVHKENYETSYHRNTAAGNLRRMVSGDAEKLLILMTVECFIEAANHDKKAEAALADISAPDGESQRWTRAAAKWHERRVGYLKQAKRLLKSIIGPELWDEGKALAE